MNRLPSIRCFKSVIPDTAKRVAKQFIRWFQHIPHRGNERYCPICGVSSRRFLSTGIIPRPDAECPYCGSLERHRLAWLLISSQTDILSHTTATFLHIAPENCLEERFRRIFGSSYVTADLMEPYVDRQIDVTSIPFDDNSFDAVYCSHVLEHVPDDAKALKEFHRILKPSGWALPVVPITAARTIEDPSVTEPAERLRLFGQDDHVRRYGPDYADRLQSAGFSVKVFNPQDLALSRDVERMALGHVRQPLHFCRKP